MNLKTVYIKTHGCQMNEYDSSQIIELLNKTNSISQVSSPQEADILLLNTCSVREKAQEKVFSELGRWRKLKDKRPEIVIGVAGCVASQEGDNITKRAPFVDLVFGPQTLHRLPNMLKLKLEQTNKKPVIDISFPEIEKFDNLPQPKANGPTAFVSIMEGCSKYCSFCIVPYTRGEEISRPFDDVLAEVYGLVQQGVKEVNLLGQNVNAYMGARDKNTPADLALLIAYIAEIEGLDRIRFTTSHPLEFSDNLIQAYKDFSKLANHLHLPVQSGSDKILTRMKRGYTALEYKAIIRNLRSVRPDISISSDFIIGFPGETDNDFADTMKLVKDIGFDNSFSFVYSKRPGTPAANYPDDVPLSTKKNRLKLLQNQINQQAQQISNTMLGTTVPVLVTGPSKQNKNILCGRTENNRIVNFSASKNCTGQIVHVQITESLTNCLRGNLMQYE